MEREEFPVDVLYVGGGISALTSAIRLSQLIEEHNENIDKGTNQGEKFDEPAIAVIEKGAFIGAHTFSGAVIDPAPLRKLFPNLDEMNMPIEGIVEKESVYYLTANKAFKFPITPRNLQNKGNYIVSLSKITKWLGDIAEEKGIMLCPEFTGVEILKENNKICGIRTGDKGINADGTEKSNFEPGNNMLSDMIVFAEGSRGHLTKELIKDYDLQGKFPQSYELGVKEVFELPEGKSYKGVIHHSTGFPLGDTGGGAFFYGMGDKHVTLGIAGSLDSKDPMFDMHEKLQDLKQHPLYKKILEGAKPVYYGGKTLSAGGYYTIPKLVVDGGILIGESAALMNPEKLKGVHLAAGSGIIAAETIFKCMVAGDYSAKLLQEYETRIRDKYVEKEIKRSRNFHAAIGAGGLKTFMHLGLQEVTFGRGLVDPMAIHEDHKYTKTVKDYYGGKAPEAKIYDNTFLLDKLSDVFLSGTTHEEQQPCHCNIKSNDTCLKCIEVYNAPCTHFCPAFVYELDENRKLKVNFTNCLHCKTCDIKCPYNNIDWRAPEGGGGPKYIMQ